MILALEAIVAAHKPGWGQGFTAGGYTSIDPACAVCGRQDEYAVPWKIEFRQELPKNFVGKVLRRVLVEESAE